MFGDMMDKLKQMQASVEESKKRLNNVTVSESLEGIQVTMNGNKKITDLSIPNDLLEDKEALEDLLITVLNKTQEAAEKVYEAEMANSAKGLIPGM
ncbi:MAG: YbaB/EbfC family nucleoid-associated protein [Flavobacteriales bacterium]|nr:YbaB/EbfC family nucleoid-associated protein [Flavobacteriales bacterium]